MAEKEQQARIDHNVRAGEYKFKVLELRARNDHSNNMFAHFGQTFGFATVVFYFSILALTVWFDNTTMFTVLFCAGAFAGLARLVRSHQKKNGDSPHNRHNPHKANRKERRTQKIQTKS